MNLMMMDGGSYCNNGGDPDKLMMMMMMMLMLYDFEDTRNQHLHIYVMSFTACCVSRAISNCYQFVI